MEVATHRDLMTKVLEERETERPIDEVQAPVDPGGRTVQKPGPEKRAPRISFGRWAQIVGAALTLLALIAIGAAALVVAWLGGAADDSARWADIQTHLLEIDDLATDAYLEASRVLRSEGGDEATFSATGREASWHIAELASVSTALSSNRDLTRGISALSSASSHLSETEVDAVVALNSGDATAISSARLALEEAFTMWRSAHDGFAEVARQTQSDALQRQAHRADLALIGILILGCLALAALVMAARVARKARHREDELRTRLNDEKDLLGAIISQLPESIGWKDKELRLKGCNPAMAERFADSGMVPPIGHSVSSVVEDGLFADRVATVEALEREVVKSGEPVYGRQMHYVASSGQSRTVIRTIVPLQREGTTIGIVSTARDVTEVIELERSLAAAGRLESIGQLSAGIAHEINTPVQFVSDNASFLDTSFGAIIAAAESLEEIANRADPDAVAAIKKTRDLEFLFEEIPDALVQSREGLDQITKIVRAMKDFAHPGGDFGPADVNRLIASTVDVSRNEWKYDAEMKLDLAEDLPRPECDQSQIKQVILNMIVNAAHAIADRGEDHKGVIAITTSCSDDAVEIKIADTGCGMPPEVMNRMFERFFTTKEVGRGSGQGLAIVHDAVRSHGGEIDVDSTLGEGTTFIITLPIKRSDEA